MLGVTKTLERTRNCCGVEKEDDPKEVTGSKAPFLTVIDEGQNEEEGWEEVSIPTLLAISEPTPKSAYHSAEDGGGVRDMVLKLLINDA
jgi:hypothetical protein